MSSSIAVQMARRTGMSDINETKATTTRPSASANFYVDSLDKLAGGSGDFTINKNQSLFNGFFNRIASAEVVMDWGLPNVAEYWGNNTITIINNGTAAVIGPVTILDGFYTAIQALEAVCDAVNTEAIVLGDPLRLTTTFNGLDVRATSSGVGGDAFYVVWQPNPPFLDPPFALARQLFTSAQLAGAATANTYISLSSPRLLGTTYIDIVSPQLTYYQDLKDATTDKQNRDVLYRWYIADDNVPVSREKFPLVYPAIAPAPAVQMLTDTNIPVLQGYNPFVLRRALPYPKQIRWSPSAPIGAVTFQCYDDRGRIISTENFAWNPATGEGGANFQFQMSMLLSED